MAVKEDIKIDQRVIIAMDALSPSQKKALEPVLHDRQSFITNATRPGNVIKIPGQKPLYQMNAGHGFKVAYSITDGFIIVQDVMRKAPSQSVGAKKVKPIHKAKERARLAKAPGHRKG